MELLMINPSIDLSENGIPSMILRDQFEKAIRIQVSAERSVLLENAIKDDFPEIPTMHKSMINALNQLESYLDHAVILGYDLGRIRCRLYFIDAESNKHSIEIPVFDAVMIKLTEGIPLLMEEEFMEEYENSEFSECEGIARSIGKYERVKTEDLMVMITEAVAKEDFEKAAELRDELKIRRKEKNG
jgi:bifunctional DNase/RNase